MSNRTSDPVSIADDPILKQIRRAHEYARPKHDNPAWLNTHHDLTYVLDLLDRLTVTSHDGSIRPSSKEDDMSKISQSIPWDPTRFAGFSEAQLELIRKGFFAAVDRVYQLEKIRDGKQRRRTQSR